MSKTTIYAHTYWCHKGKYPELQEKVQALVPSEGEVPDAERNPALERFRRAANCYYDLYNNGLCNLLDEFKDVFGFEPIEFDPESGYIEELTKGLVNLVERKMDGFILAAAKEQGIEVAA